MYLTSQQWLAIYFRTYTTKTSLACVDWYTCLQHVIVCHTCHYHLVDLHRILWSPPDNNPTNVPTNATKNCLNCYTFISK